MKWQYTGCGSPRKGKTMPHNETPQAQWDSWWATRPHYELFGTVPDYWLEKLRQQLPTMLWIVGPFGAGKTTIWRNLPSIYTLHTKGSDRSPRSLEVLGKDPYCNLGYKSMFYGNEPAFAGAIMGLCWPYPEWVDLAPTLGIAPPDIEDLANTKGFEEVVGCFLVRTLIDAMIQVASSNGVFCLELASIHVFDWIRLFEKWFGKRRLAAKLHIVELETTVETRIRRLDKRAEENPNTNPTILTARKFESAATPMGITYPQEYDQIVIRNEDGDRDRVVDGIRELCEPGAIRRVLDRVHL